MSRKKRIIPKVPKEQRCNLEKVIISEPKLLRSGFEIEKKYLVLAVGTIINAILIFIYISYKLNE